MEKMSVMVVDDEEIIREEIKEYFGRKNIYRMFVAEKPSQCYKILSENTIDIVILDINMPEEDGLSVLVKIKNNYPNIEVIMITGQGDDKILNQATKLGALDFFFKPVGLVEIQQTIERTNRYINLKNQLNRIKKNYNVVSEILKLSEINIIGDSEEIKNVIELTLKAASSPDTSVLITGPSGSGKELIAKVLHYKSERKDEVFLPVNCSAIPDNLIESEFFGYKKGAFTGANEDKMGFFEAANNGTLFLDEIGDLSVAAQSKILRAIEDRKIKRVGDTKDININVRIVSATNKDLYSMSSEKTFREDLFYRLNIIEIKIPPLKERQSDIPQLVEYYTEYYASKIKKRKIDISRKVIDLLMGYSFPGNIRELKNIIERAVILCDGIIDLNHISIADKKNDNSNKEIICENAESATFDLSEIEKNTIIKALVKCKYNQTQTAKLLNISVFSLSRKIKKYSIEAK